MASKKNAAAALLVLLTFAAYWPALQGGLIMDDARHITRISLRSIHGLYRIWFEPGATSQYYPLLHSVFWAEYRIWGDAVTGYHLVNVALHAGSALLLVAILQRLKISGAWVAGFLFAVHPLCVESVAWISEQKNTLSTIFYMGAALAYLRFDEERDRQPYLIALGLFVLALLSKSVTATLPVALLIVFWWQRGKLDRARDLLPMAPFLVIGAAAGLFTAWMERTYIGATGPDFALSIPARIGLAGRLIWFYLQKVVWPFGYVFVYPRWNAETLFLWPVLALALLGVLVWFAKTNRGPLAAFLIFVVTLFPVLGFLNVYPFLYSYAWDHFVYLAGPAVIALLAAALPRPAGGVAVAALAALTFLHAGTFRDASTLYTDTIQRNPSAWVAHNNLGAELMKTPGHLPEAVEHLQTALKLEPQTPVAHFNLGAAFETMPGRMPDAIKEYETALRLKEDNPEAHNSLGRELVKIPGREAEGLAHLETALGFNPDFAEAHVNLGVALSHLPGKRAEALGHLETALRLDPGIPGGRDALELVLSSTPGREAESIGYFETRVREHPESADLQNALANALRNQPEHVAEAIQHFREAIRLKPDFIEAHMNLANTLMKLPDRQNEAAAEYQTVLHLNPHFPEAHNNLGNAFAALNGRTAEAMKEFEAAIRDDPASADPHVNLGAILFNTPGRMADAIRELEAAVRLDPNFPDARTDLGLALLQMPGRTNEALAQFEASLRLRPDRELQLRVEQLRKVIDQKTSLSPN